jgi:hypothetical protein
VSCVVGWLTLCDVVGVGLRYLVFRGLLRDECTQALAQVGRYPL